MYLLLPNRVLEFFDILNIKKNKDFFSFHKY